MKITKIKKLCAVALTFALGVGTLVGCGGSDNGGDSAQELIYNLGTETKTIDPALNNAVDGSIVIANAFEGLCRTDENDKAIPGVAEKWEVSEDQLTYTFHLREDAKWSDGEPVKAGDFAYAWTRALDPATAAEYAFQLYYIENAEEFNAEKTKDNGEKYTAADLGIKVVDDKTLEVKLAKPTTYFLELTAFPTLMPVREDKVSANPDGWTLDPESYITNGPFKLEEYNMKDSYVFVKNDNYHDKDSVKLDKLTLKMISESTSGYASVKNGEIDGTDNVPSAEVEQGKADGIVQIFPQLGNYFYCLNVGNNIDQLDPAVKEALGKKEFRQALNLSIDRKSIVEKITKGGETPAYSYVPAGIPGGKEGTEFADKKYWNPEQMDENIAKAKELLSKAGYPNGEGLPTFKLSYNTEATENKLIAEATQQMWANIGVKVELQNSEWKVFQDQRKSGKFEIARHGWVGDYVDPMTFIDMWMTGLGNNDAKFANAEYDNLVREAMIETNAEKRAEILRKAEDILMDEMPILPVYYKTQVKAISPQVKDVRVSPLGTIYFDKAYKAAE